MGLQLGSAVAGIGAAVLWFRSAAAKAPPATFIGIDRLEAFLIEVGRLNRWAAGITALSVLLSAASTLLGTPKGV